MSLGIHMPDVLARTMVTDQCWLWLGSRSTKGYGQVYREGAHLQVHRIAFESEYGDIPEGLVIDHLCHDPEVCVGGTCVHRICVNPAHLAAVTNEANLRRQTPAAKTHCLYGHELTGENTGRGAKGTRFCKTCRAKAFREYRQTQHSVAPSVVREWAIENGYSAGPRGRFSRVLIAAWDAAHPDQPYCVTKPDDQAA